ncbi:MAG TPA: DUF2905 domain-containing protein [Gemmatimonadota bacterium]|nr:DUF2905 domain-containing protein [Gemmatimonadota bacterium]
MGGLARFLILFGGISIVVGLILLAGQRIPFLGRLPGDLLFRKGSATVYIPLATSLLLSLVLTILLNIVFRR